MRPGHDGPLAAGNSADNQERLFPGCDCFGQRRVRQLVGQILFAGEETQESPPLLRAVVADGAAQHRITGLKGIQDRALRYQTLDFKLDFTADVRQSPEMLRKFDSNHVSSFLSCCDLEVAQHFGTFQLFQ